MGRVGASAPGWGGGVSVSSAFGVSRAKVGFPFFHRRINRIEHGIQFVFDFMVPEADGAIALALEPFCSTLIMALLVIEAVMGSVHLDDQLQPV